MEQAQPNQTIPCCVKVTDPGHSYYGEIGRVFMIYYDYRHTGDSPDVLYTIMQDGKTMALLSTGVEAVLGVAS